MEARNEPSPGRSASPIPIQSAGQDTAGPPPRRGAVSVAIGPALRVGDLPDAPRVGPAVPAFCRTSISCPSSKSRSRPPLLTTKALYHRFRYV